MLVGAAMIKVVFFANLREQLQCAELMLAPINIENITALKDELLLLHPEWMETFQTQKLLVAVNHEMAHWQSPLKAGDEVAFFPPVTGG
jgi:sulfur-carrier protein